MNNYTKVIELIRNAVDSKMEELQKAGRIKSESKRDKTIVTEMDYFVSNFCKEQFKNMYPELGFFSEEDQDEGINYPTIILDPIDGTKEFAAGIPECVVSLAIINSEDINDPKNYAWLYNPYNKFEVSSSSIEDQRKNQTREQNICFVSNTEFESGLHVESEYSPDLVKPVGSIAYKLGLLAIGDCDYVVSKKPKNIWDIAAGIVLLHKVGIEFYMANNRVNSLKQRKYNSPLVWK